MSSTATALVVAPQIEEVEALLHGFRRRGYSSEPVQIGSMECAAVPSFDVVVSTTTVEHDYKLRFVRAPLPRHQPAEGLLQEFREVTQTHTFPFRVHFGPVASGDEDIVDPQRAQELRAATGALCAAWEGSGGARAATFSDLAFLEVRGITDGADADALSSFHENLARVMSNIGNVLVHWHVSTRGSGDGPSLPA